VETPTITPASQETPLPEDTLVLEDVSGSAEWIIDQFQPLADYLVKKPD
jgi:hypothetical protein